MPPVKPPASSAKPPGQPKSAPGETSARSSGAQPSHSSLTGPHGSRVQGLQLPEQLSWFLLLLPGFVLVSVMGVVTERPEWSEIEFTAYSLIGSVFCFGLTVPIYLLAAALRNRLRRASRRSRPSRSFALPAAFVVLNFILAAIVGGLAGMAFEHDASVNSLNSALGVKLDKRSWMRPLKYVLQNNHFGRLTQMEVDGRSPALTQRRTYVKFNFKDGPSYEGWPFLTPHGNAMTEVYLSPACRQKPDKSDVELIQGPGVVVPMDGYLSVELIDRAGSNCFALVKAQASCKACESCLHEAALGPSDAASNACGQCATESKALAMSTLIHTARRQEATTAAQSCTEYVECREGNQSVACKANLDACGAAAKVAAASAPSC